MKLFIMHKTSCYFLLGLYILLRTSFSNILSLSSSLNVRDQVVCPYRIKDTFIVMPFQYLKL